MSLPRGRYTPEERFRMKITTAPSGCWIWPGHLTTDHGYGLFYVDPVRKVVSAHRWSYATFIGPIQPGLTLDHLCHTRDLDCPGGDICLHRRCVRPDHLEPVTHRVNNLRSRLNLAAINAAKTECPLGHPYDDGNTYINGGRRSCRVCTRERSRRWSAINRPPVGPRPLVTECSHGHALTGDNLRVSVPGGVRVCRKCERIRCDAYRARKKAVA